MHPERRLNPQRSPEALEEKLRALPQPSVPDGLESRLLAGIPASLPARRRRWPVWVAAVGVVAAACVLVVLVWSGRDRKEPGRSVDNGETVRKESPQRSIHPEENNPPLPRLGRDLDAENLPAFTWPIPESSPETILTSLPAGELD